MLFRSNNCSSSPQSCLAVSVASTAPAIPSGGITGLTTVCSGTTGAVYSVSPVASATIYTWTMPTSGSGTVTAGQGTTTAIVTFGSTSGNICVTAGNACGTSLPTCQMITVDPNPAVGTAGTITGPTSGCTNQTGVTYSIPAVTNATSYAWTVPSTATITAGQGTNTITLTFGNVSGNICVTANNTCGTSPASCIPVTVSPSSPAIPTGITGAATVCNGQAGTNYSIPPVANATVYTWTVPTGATVVSGQGSTGVSVNFGSTSGNICVTAGNGCGTSLPSCQPITVSSTALTVSTTVTNTSNSSVCDGSATASPSGGTGPYTYAWIPSGLATATVTGLCFGSHTVCVTDAGGCITCSTINVSSPTGVPALTDNGSINIFPNPANDFLYVEGTISAAARLQVNILSLYGQKIMNRSINTNGSFSEKIGIEGIPSGVYFIEIRSGEFVKESRFIKIQ